MDCECPPLGDLPYPVSIDLSYGVDGLYIADIWVSGGSVVVDVRGTASELSYDLIVEWTDASSSTQQAVVGELTFPVPGTEKPAVVRMSDYTFVDIPVDTEEEWTLTARAWGVSATVDDALDSANSWALQVSP